MMMMMNALPAAMRKAALAVIPIVVAMLTAAPLSANDRFSYDVRLIEALAKAGFEDYSSLQFQRAMQAYPDRQDQIRLARGRALFAGGRRSQAADMLRQIPTTSPLYAQSRRLIAEAAYARQDWETAAAAYRDFFSKHDRPVSRDPGAVQDFMQAVQAYADVAINQGDTELAGRVLGYLDNIEDDRIDPTQITFLRHQATLAAASQRADKGEDIDKPAVARAIQALERIQLDTTNYRLIINSLIEAAHGYILLGNHSKGLETLQNLSDLLGQAPRDTPDSPLAAAYYYFGRALKGQAQDAFRADDRDTTRTRLLQALRFFERVTRDFGGSMYETRALVEIGRTRALIERIFPDQELPRADDSGQIVLALREADNNLRAGNFGRAAQLYLSALRRTRTGSRVPEIINKLAYCWGQQGEFLKAQALAAYAAEVFPESRRTAETLLQVGAVLYEKYTGERDEAEQERWLDEAIGVWDRFVALAPDHQSAPEIAFLIAENTYRKAEQLMRQAPGAGSRAERQELETEARRLFAEAVPLYERMFDGPLATSARGIRALYKLAWTHYALDNPRESAEAFLQYVVLESNPEHRNDRLEAKFRAAEQLMRSENPGDAIPHFEQLLAWLQPDSATDYDKDSDIARRIRVDAASYLAWSHDLSAESLRPRLRQIDTRISFLDDAVSRQQAAIEAAEDRIREADELQQQARDDFEGMQEQQAEGLPDPYAQALTQTMPSEEDMRGWTEAEREQRRRLARQEAEQFARELLQNVRLQIQGEREELTAERDNINREIARLRERGEQLEERARELRTQRNTVESNLDDARGRLARRRQQVERARQAVNQLEQDAEKWRTQMARARDMLREGDAQQQAEAREIGREAQRNLLDTRHALEEARAEFNDVNSDEMQRRIAALQDEVEGLEERKQRIAADIVANQHEQALLATEQDIAVARLQFVAAMLRRNQALGQIMAVARAERQNAAEQRNWSQLTDNALQAGQTLMEHRIAKGDVLKQNAQEDIAIATRAIEDVQTDIAALRSERQPIQETFNERKRRAMAEFERFVEAYPNADQHLPSNMARIGTIALQFDMYDKAAAYFERLQNEYPDHDALRDAMYNLGRSQFETGQIDEAVAAFEDVLKAPAEQPTANLNRIARMMSEAGRHAIALQALGELLRRSQDPAHPDYDMLVGGTRESFLFRAANAAYRAQEHTRAARYVTTLIDENPRAGVYFDSLILRARARRHMQPPQLLEARQDLAEVISQAQDNVLVVEALVEQAKVFLAYDDEEGVRRAIGLLTQIVLVDEGEVIYLVDHNDPAIRDLLEDALYSAAQAYALAGQIENRELVVAAYREEFPNGRFVDQMGRLPAARYRLQTSQAPTPTGSVEQ